MPSVRFRVSGFGGLRFRFEGLGLDADLLNALGEWEAPGISPAVNLICIEGLGILGFRDLGFMIWRAVAFRAVVFICQ